MRRHSVAAVPTPLQRGPIELPASDAAGRCSKGYAIGRTCGHLHGGTRVYKLPRPLCAIRLRCVLV